MVIRRFAANARLIVAVLAGAILAAALLSTTSIYTGAIRDLGLSYALQDAGPNALNPLVRSSSQTAELDVYTRARDQITSLAQQRFGSLIEGSTHLGRTSTFYPATVGEPYPEEESRPRGYFQFMTDLEEHITVTEGRWPNAAPGGSGAPSVEVALSAATARENGITLGQSFDLYPFFLQDAAPVHVTIVGFIEPLNLRDPYWRGFTDLLDYPSTGWATFPFFVPEDTFFGAVGSYLPQMSSDYWSVFYLDTSSLESRNAELTRLNFVGFQQSMRSQFTRTEAETAMPRVLATYDEKLFFTRVPLLVLVLQIAAIVLYYLFMVSTMLVERQAPEIALLKSRGATTPQVMQIYAIEGLIVFLVALALGPPLAATVVSLLGQTPPFQDLSGGSNLAVRLTTDAYLWAAAGALLAYVTLLWPAYQATRRTVVQQRALTARPPKQSFFTRYYLDLVLVGLGAVLYYQLDRNGSLTTESVFGEQSIDPVRLLTPAFFILTIGIVFLRLFPLVLRLLSVIASKGQGSAVMVGMWHLVRNPVHYSRLVLLLMLATAVGTFAASFGSTLSRSYDDRAAYAAGSGLRMSSIRSAQVDGPNQLIPMLQEQTGASVASPVIRLKGSPESEPNQSSVIDFDILGVEPQTMAQIGFYREDFAGGSMQDRLAKLETEPVSGGIPLPPDTRYLGMWFNPTELRGRVAVDIRVIDATGRYFNYTFGPENGLDLAPGWYGGVVDLQAPLRSFAQLQFAAAPAQGPFILDSISIRFGTRVSAIEGAVLLDNLQASAQPPLEPFILGRVVPAPDRSLALFSESTLVESFDAMDGWMPIQGITLQPLNDEVRSVSQDGLTFAEMRWRGAGANPLTHGIRPRETTAVMPALASKSFLAGTGTAVGDTVRIVVNNIYFPVQIVDDFDLFPTLEDPRRAESLIVPVEALARTLSINPRVTPLYPDEIWFDPAPGSEAALLQLVDARRIVGTTTSFEALRAQQESDPLVAAGWEGILFISFAAILLLSAIGFLIYSYLTAQKRTLEFAVLRTMGFSKRQIAMVVAFEQFFVIGLGMVAGTLLGLRLGTLMIRYMGVTETGAETLPPMVLNVSWTTIGTAWLVLGAAFLVTIGIVVLLYSRLALHRVLRIGES